MSEQADNPRPDPKPAPRNDYSSDIILSLDIPRPPGYWFDALTRQSRPFANFVRELGTLILLTGILGALNEHYPSNGAGALYAISLIATSLMLLNTIGLRLKFVTHPDGEENGVRWYISWAFNLICFFVIWFTVHGWINDVRDALVAMNLASLPPTPQPAPNTP